MPTKELPSPELLRKLLDYDPKTGDLWWKPRPVEMFVGGSDQPEGRCKRWNNRFAHKKALTALSNGYRHGKILGSKYRAHRVIWALVTGKWPVQEIDHVDGNKINNALSNLREATRVQNAANLKLSTKNTSGYKGVCWDKHANRWKASIKHKGKNFHLGYFECPKKAHEAYRDASVRLKKTFSNFG